MLCCLFLTDRFGAGIFEDEGNGQELEERGSASAEPADDPTRDIDHEQDDERDDDERFRAGTVVYISGEENNSQVAARAAR